MIRKTFFNKVIVALSGGLSSAYVAKLAFDEYEKEDIILYFNDTKWEHEDLYRFLNDISTHFNHEIFYDSDGRNPEDVFFDEKFLGNSRIATCSKILKAERLQRFYNDGDIILFGINNNEKSKDRDKRLIDLYSNVSRIKKKDCFLRFPLIEKNITKEEILNYFQCNNIEIPKLYKLGFEHNNCSGGCVRAGKKQWKLLYEKLPDVFSERERVEREFNEIYDNKYTILKDISLEDFRKKLDSNDFIPEPNDNLETIECIGICTYEN